MKGKSLLFTAILVLGCFVALSQEFTHEAKMVEVYGQEWVNSRKLDSPDLLSLMDNYISFGFVVEEVSEEKFKGHDQLELIPLTSKTEQFITVDEFLKELEDGSFNPLKYKFFPVKDGQLIKLKGVNKIIRILPQSSLLK
jgi:hypothetical protein